MNIRSRSWSLSLLLTLVSFLSITGCGGGSDSATTEPPIGETDTEFTQFTSPDDNTMLSAKTAEGDTVTYFGLKNSEGIPTSLESVRVDDDQGNSTWLHFNENGDITRIQGPEGTTFDLEKLNDNEYQVSAIDASGDIQINTVVNTSTLSSKNSPSSILQTKSNLKENLTTSTASRSNRNIEISVDHNNLTERNIAQKQLLARESGNISVSVTQCNNVPVSNAQVYFKALSINSDTSLIPTCPAFEQSPGSGRYEGSVPFGNQPLTGVIAQNACNGLTEVLSISCGGTAGLRSAGVGVFCGALSVAIDALPVTGGPTGEASIIFSACNQAAFPAFNLYCDTVDQLPPVPGFLCSQVGKVVESHPSLQQQLSNSKLTLSAVASLSGRGQKESNSVTFNPFIDSFPTFNIDFGGDIAIEKLSTTPSSPVGGQDYSVVVKPACAVGSVVTINVNGTDGYSDTKEFMPDSTDMPLIVSVPGGGQSVTDTITVTMVSPEFGFTGPITTQRSISITFR